MRVLAAVVGAGSVILCALVLCVETQGQNQPQPPTHVIIPNPTPRDPDLKQVFDEDADGQKKQQKLLIMNQLRAREIWLESNQILLLAQQLEQDIVSGKKTASMKANSAKVGQIEKLAQSVQEKMKTQ